MNHLKLTGWQRLTIASLFSVIGGPLLSGCSDDGLSEEQKKIRETICNDSTLSEEQKQTQEKMGLSTEKCRDNMTKVFVGINNQHQSRDELVEKAAKLRQQREEHLKATRCQNQANGVRQGPLLDCP
ncbi:MAG: hypothetical protein H6868_00870 [Rhodospirillales bacterium]|nr:hypothetical protein [Rhodospirillales bacterium]